MRRLLSRPLALYCVISVLVFIALTFIVPNYILIPILNGVCLGVVGAVTIVFSPLIFRALKERSFNRVSQIVTGMVLLWLSLLGSRMASVYVTITGNAASVANSPVVSLLAYLGIIGGILHISGPGMVEQEWRYDKRTLAIGVGFGIMFGIIAILLQSQYGFCRICSHHK